MQINEKLIEIGKKLPRGGIQEIHRVTGLTEKTVSAILSGKRCRAANFKKVLEAAKTILQEQRELIDSFNEM